MFDGEADEKRSPNSEKHPSKTSNNRYPEDMEDFSNRINQMRGLNEDVGISYKTWEISQTKDEDST